MRIVSDRRYCFRLDRAGFWHRISEVDRYRDWWPWLRRLDAVALAPGERWRCTVQPPLPYTLDFELYLDEVVTHERVRARLAGDIVGTAQLVVGDHGDGCEVRLSSHLAPGSRFLQRIAALARPVVRHGHDWVLDTGARQFAEHTSAR